jgi:hypothetical protein
MRAWSMVGREKSDANTSLPVALATPSFLFVFFPRILKSL